MKRKQLGFTLVELVIVLMVFGGIALLGVGVGLLVKYLNAPPTVQAQVQKVPSELVPRCSGGFLLNGETVMTTPDRKAIRC